jgi:hypothetical protein
MHPTVSLKAVIFVMLLVVGFLVVVIVLRKLR